MKNLSIAVCLLCLLAAAPALADMTYGTVNAKYTIVTPGMPVQIWSQKYTSGINAWTGVYNLQLSGLDDSGLGHVGVPDSWEPYLAGDVQSFCIDIFDNAPTSLTNYRIVPLDEAPDPESALVGGMGSTKAGAIAALLDAHWTSSLSDIQAAALQAAIWEIVDEEMSGTWNVSMTNGNFYVGNSDVANIANDWLKGLGTAPYMSSYVALTNGDSWGGSQDYVVRVPVPGAVLLGILGLSAAGLKLRKFA